MRFFSFSKDIERIQERPEQPQGRIPGDVRMQGSFDWEFMGRVALDRLSIKAPCRMAQDRDDDSQTEEER